jgi:gluconokinase
MMGAERCILALDVGSSSVRARLYDGRLRALPTNDAALRRYSWGTSGGAMEGDPHAMTEHFIRVVDAAMEVAADLGYRIHGVGIATFWHSLIGLDVEGGPLTPVFGWGDARAAPATDRLRRRIGEDEFRELTGCFLNASYPAVKLRWLADTRPEVVAAARTWTSFADYVVSRLFGSRATSRSLASATGLFDRHRGDWAPAILDAVGVAPAAMPDLVDLEPLIGLRPQWADRWPALADVPWYPPLGDGACANVGVGAMGSDRPCLTVGTSAAVRVLWRSRTGLSAPADLWSYRLDAEYRVSGGALSNGGNGLAYLLGIFPDLDRVELSRVLANDPPGLHGLTVIPSLFPERGIGWTGESSAAILGIGPETSPVRIAQAWLEAIAQRSAALLGRIEAAFGETTWIRATGGGLHAIPGWLQVFADATGRPVSLARDREATSRGAAVVVARELGWIPALEEAPHDEIEPAMPDPARGDLHRQAARRRDRIGRALTDRSVTEA